ncbi:MAG TPA: RNase H family protein [Patescibacteria group bacterium]|nr:RNase H family protein [Patescibacteria group bacterium]
MTCRHCGTALIIKPTQRKASQLSKAYYYTAYYFCPNCKRIYHDEKFKVINSVDESPTLFALDSHFLPAGRQGHGKDRKVDVEIWTDGACTNNGNPKAKAAWAFASGVYEEAGLVKGKQTNNIAEALAVYQALKWAVKQGYKSIRIYSDSQITIHNLQKTFEKIKANQDIFKKILDLIEEKQLIVQYVKVAGHSGEVNNERVDRLANGLVVAK